MTDIKNPTLQKIVDDYRFALQDHRDEFVDKLYEQFEAGDYTQEDLEQAEKGLVEWENNIWKFGKQTGSYQEAFEHNNLLIALNDLLSKIQDNKD